MADYTANKMDRALAKVCECCPVCNHAREKQKGLAFGLVCSVEERVCPFCRSYERVHGRKAHESLADAG